MLMSMLIHTKVPNSTQYFSGHNILTIIFPWLVRHFPIIFPFWHLLCFKFSEPTNVTVFVCPDSHQREYITDYCIITTLGCQWNIFSVHNHQQGTPILTALRPQWYGKHLADSIFKRKFVYLIWNFTEFCCSGIDWQSFSIGTVNQ